MNPVKCRLAISAGFRVSVSSIIIARMNSIIYKSRVMALAMVVHIIPVPVPVEAAEAVAGIVIIVPVKVEAIVVIPVERFP